jgi:hypothetical protein
MLKLDYRPTERGASYAFVVDNSDFFLQFIFSSKNEKKKGSKSLQASLTIP